MGNWGFCTIERVVKCNENRREKERKGEKKWTKSK